MSDYTARLIASWPDDEDVLCQVCGKPVDPDEARITSEGVYHRGGPITYINAFDAEALEASRRRGCISGALSADETTAWSDLVTELHGGAE